VIGVARKRVVSNPLALAVLACLRERPMHPYEMATTLRERGKEHSIKLNYGSLYTVVDNLTKHGLIEAMQAQREGRRPERTVYRLTEAGGAELDDWMSELLAVPAKEYPQFEAALSLMPVLPPDRVVALLRARTLALEQEISEVKELMVAALRAGLPRLVLIEGEYHLAMQDRELAWTRELLTEIEGGTLDGLGMWRRWQETGEFPHLEPDFSAAQAPHTEGGGPTA
jgi:DNA-binding PadR family transcriptional regulator